MLSETVMNIAFSINSKYVRYAYVMLTSLFKNQSANSELHIYFLYSELKEKERQSLANLVEFYHGEAHFLFVDKNRFPLECPVTMAWSLEAYYRLLLMELLPESVKRILYLDVDIIVNKSLQELYNIDFEENMLCACQDVSKQPFSDNRDAILRNR